MPILVKDIMTKPVLTVDINKNAKIAAELMKRTRTYTLVVTKSNKPIGIITDSDLIKKVVAKNTKPSSIVVKKIMSTPLVSVGPNETVLEITRKMKRSNIKRLPVIDNGKLVGIISLSDVASACPELIDLLEYKLLTRESEPVIREKFTSGMCELCDNYTQNLQNVDGRWVCEDCVEEVET
jgi:CBS domain-containing protein